MTRALAIVGLVAFLWGVGFVTGYAVRDGRADASIATVETAVQTARADQAEQARATDHANAQVGASVQQQRADAHAESATQFRIIERRVVEYVHANPDPVGCGLSPDGLRIWNEASAGAPGPEPGSPGGPAVE